MFKFEVDFDGINEIKNLLDAYPNRAEQSASRAINRTLQMLSTQIAKEIVEKYNIKKTQVRPELSFFRATQRKAEGALRFRKWGLFLDEFIGNTISKQKPPLGISVEVEKGKKKLYQGSFLVKGRNSGKSILFKRDGSKKLPITRMVGIGIYQMIDKDKYEKLEDTMRAKFIEEFKRQMEGDF